jgi:hypothetical protein
MPGFHVPATKLSATKLFINHGGSRITVQQTRVAYSVKRESIVFVMMMILHRDDATWKGG